MAADFTFLALPLCLHVGKGGVSALLQGQFDAFHEKIMDFAPLVESDLPQCFISGFWQVDTRMFDVRARPAASGLRCGAKLSRGLCSPSKPALKETAGKHRDARLL